MPLYTVTLLDAQGRPRGRSEIDARDDDHITDIAGFIRHPHAIDIHQDDRHVVRFPPKERYRRNPE